MNDKIIIEFGFRGISRINASIILNIPLNLNNYAQQQHEDVDLSSQKSVSFSNVRHEVRLEEVHAKWCWISEVDFDAQGMLNLI